MGALNLVSVEQLVYIESNDKGTCLWWKSPSTHFYFSSCWVPSFPFLAPFWFWIFVVTNTLKYWFPWSICVGWGFSPIESLGKNCCFPESKRVSDIRVKTWRGKANKNCVLFYIKNTNTFFFYRNGPSILSV